MKKYTRLLFIIVLLAALGVSYYYFSPYPGQTVYLKNCDDDPVAQAQVLSYLASQFGLHPGSRFSKAFGTEPCPYFFVFDVTNYYLAHKDVILINQYLSEQKITNINVYTIRKDFLFPNGL
jgi:hypothetical protein